MVRHFSRATLTWCLAAWALSLAACAESEPPRTGTILVGVTSDFVPGPDIGSLEALVSKGEEPPTTVTWAVGSSRKLSFPLELPLSDLPDATLIDVLFSAREGTSKDEHPFLTREAATSAVAGETLLLRVHLEWECVPSFHLPGGALAPECQSPDTCVAAACEDPYSPPSDLTPYSPDWAVDFADECRPEDAGPASVAVGQGLESYVPVAAGDPVIMHAGPQGGYHVWLALRSQNIHQKGSNTSLTVTLAGTGKELCSVEVPWDFTPSEEGSCDLAGIQCVVAYDIAGANALDGQTASISAKVRDLTGDVAFGGGDFTLALPSPE